MAIGLVPHKRFPLYCSFCGKNKDEVAYLVSGPTVFICNECVELCRKIGTEMLVENAVLSSSFRCDSCDNGVELEWEFCAWCGATKDWAPANQRTALEK